MHGNVEEGMIMYDVWRGLSLLRTEEEKHFSPQNTFQFPLRVENSIVDRRRSRERGVGGGGGQ